MDLLFKFAPLRLYLLMQAVFNRWFVSYIMSEYYSSIDSANLKISSMLSRDEIFSSLLFEARFIGSAMWQCYDAPGQMG
jgi:hypothetical protein